MNILVVEDDDTQYNSYKDAVDDLNESEEEEVCLIRATDASSAIEKLKQDQFHGAIIDLQLFGDTGNTATGNKVIEQIQKKFRIPIIIISGNLDNLDPSIVIPTNGLFYKTYIRSEKDNIEIFTEFLGLYKTGIFNIIGGTGLIEQKLSDVFWNHLSQDIDAWIPAEDGTEKSLLRYTLNHLLAYLDLSENDQTHNICQNAEFYLKPPVKPHISAGDILIDTNDNRYLLLSPACDVEVREIISDTEFAINAKTLVLGKIHKVDEASFISNSLMKVDANKKTKNKALEKIIQGLNPKFLFLPDYKELEAGIINLQELKTINLSTYISQYERKATVSRDYLKEIQSRFSSYYGRQGQPDLNKKALLKKHVF